MNPKLESDTLLFIVTREMGEYSDRTEFSVIAYDNEAAAKYHVVRASELAHVFDMLTYEEKDTQWEGVDKSPIGVWDPTLRMSYSSFDTPRYYYSSVPKACLMMDELLKIQNEDTP